MRCQRCDSSYAYQVDFDVHMARHGELDTIAAMSTLSMLNTDEARHQLYSAIRAGEKNGMDVSHAWTLYYWLESPVPV